MNIVIIDYGSGNLRSAEKAFLRVAAGRKSAGDVVVTARPDIVAAADYIVLPGVGAFGDCAAGLAAIDGLVEALTQRVCIEGRPFLGICVGMQLLCARGLERGTHAGLGWIEADVVPLDLPPVLKVPHMGWNDLTLTRPHKVFDGLDGEAVYFAHSFAVRALGDVNIVATTDYGGAVVAGLVRDNICGTQFHPEKSQHVGARLIGNFLDWRP